MSTVAGRHVDTRLIVELFRDSPFVYVRDVSRYVTGTATDVSLFFPTLAPGVQWDATTVANVATFDFPMEVANAIPAQDSTGADTPAELWVDGECVASGRVVRGGGDVDLPSPTPGGGVLYPSNLLYPRGD